IGVVIRTGGIFNAPIRDADSVFMPPPFCFSHRLFSRLDYFLYLHIVGNPYIYVSGGILHQQLYN
ncbi:MAG: hypothetical protein J6K28_03780, partial [Alistipes sp.]|nr:hypothetical protein [Alistipes sp.]